MPDDDLRFGDVSGSRGNKDITEWLVTLFQVVILVYVILKVVEILFNVPIPLI